MKKMYIAGLKRVLIIGLFILISAQAWSQSDARFNQSYFNYNRHVSSGIGYDGFAVHLLGRSVQDTTYGYLSVDVPIRKIYSSVGGYYLQKNSSNEFDVQGGLAYNFFIPFSDSCNLRFGIQGNLFQQAPAFKVKALREYKADTAYWTGDLSAALIRGKMFLGLSFEDFFTAQSTEIRDYVVFIGLNELQSYTWLKSSPSVMYYKRAHKDRPEWDFNYTGTIGNFLLLGGTYHKNQYYKYGFNAGLKLFNNIWLTASTDFTEIDVNALEINIYEFGVKFRINKSRAKAPGMPSGTSEPPVATN